MILLAIPARAAVYHVTPSNWVSVVTGSGLQPGDEVVLAGGTYTLNGNIAIRHRGTAENPIVIRAAEGEQVIFTAASTRNVLHIEGAQ